MKVLLVHNSYREPGGEDAVFVAEASLLRRQGNGVFEYTESNSPIINWQRLPAILHTIWSVPTKRKLGQMLRETKPGLVHFHNTFMRVSPSAYHACKEAGVPVVQTLHNYRLLCPTATFFRDGRVCEDCINKTPAWPGVLHGCWRGSRAGTAVVATMLTVHRWLKTWERQVDIYIALTEFARSKFIEGGLPAEKIVVKPNFVHPDPGVGVPGQGREGYALFVGRLSPEKGVRRLLRPWRQLRGIPLKIVGDGPLMEEVRAFVEREGLDDVEVLGRRPREEVFALMREARFLVFPSQCYETFGMTIAEAFACGVPVIASRLGAMAEIVEDGRTGLLFRPGDPEDMAAKVEWTWTHPKQMAEMGREARKEYEAKYTAECNYQMLMEIYERAIENSKRG